MVAHRESAALAERLIGETCEKQGIEPGQLTLHADRGTSMTSKPVALLLADLGVVDQPTRENGSPGCPTIDDRLLGRPEGRLDFTDLRSLKQPHSNYVDLGVSMSLTGSGMFPE
jgi:hypothetical protein